MTEEINNTYSVDSEIVHFFTQTSATQAECNATARNFTVSDEIVPVTVQGVCSYTVYAGSKDANGLLDKVVQFRLKSLKLNMEMIDLAREVYEEMAPRVKFVGEIGEDDEEKIAVDEVEAGKGEGGKQTGEPLCIYVMDRVKGVSYLDFSLKNNTDGRDNTPEWFAWRKNLITDVARFHARAWTHPLPLPPSTLTAMHESHSRDLHLLLSTLPPRFHPIVHRAIAALPSIFSPTNSVLPTVLLHEDFGEANILVDDADCHLVGVVDWGEARIAPFGLTLDMVQTFMGKFHLKKGWIRYEDWDALEETFWRVLREEVRGVVRGAAAAGGAGKQGGDGGNKEEGDEKKKEKEFKLIDDKVEKVIKAARVVGLLMTWGFTGRLGNMSAPTPIRDDESGAYNLLWLDGLLIQPETRLDDLSG